VSFLRGTTGAIQPLVVHPGETATLDLRFQPWRIRRQLRICLSPCRRDPPTSALRLPARSRSGTGRMDAPRHQLLVSFSRGGVRDEGQVKGLPSRLNPGAESVPRFPRPVRRWGSRKKPDDILNEALALSGPVCHLLIPVRPTRLKLCTKSSSRSRRMPTADFSANADGEHLHPGDTWDELRSNAKRRLRRSISTPKTAASPPPGAR